MNQRQRNLIQEALELKALLGDADTHECLELLEQLDKLCIDGEVSIKGYGAKTPIPAAGSHRAEFGKRGCPKCSEKLELRVFHDGATAARWPYCVRCGKRRHRALSVEDAIKFQKGELQL
jgi:hypothetical protein